MPKLTIDAEEVEVAAGTTILQAVLSQGRVVPHYCYHPGLTIAGNCRMCLVEVEKAPKLVIGCATTVTDGMVVRTESDQVKKARAAMMEFFLLNHPLDCPICDQAGECKLQDYAVEHGRGVSRSIEPRLASNKAVDIGPHVMLDQERCIQCSRCIRFCDEVMKTGELAFFRRGERTVIGVAPGRPLDNLYSGNVVDICPVGALTLKEFRFRTRVWYLKNTPSACVACARNCSILVGTGTQAEIMTTRGQQDERIKRLVPRYNPEVNGHWMCDIGRLSFQRIDEAPRLLEARVAGESAPWEDAVAQAAETLRAAGKGKVAISLSPRLTCEELWAWRALAEALGAVVSVRRIVRGEDDALLLRADKGGNTQGAAWIVGSAALDRSLKDLVTRGGLDVLVVVGDPLDPADTPVLPDKAAVPTVLFVGPHLAGAAESARIALPAAAWSEAEGTVVNFQGQVQRMGRARLSPGEGRPGWRIVADLAEALALPLPSWTAAAEVFAALAAAVPELSGLTHADLGMLGVRAGHVPAGA